VGFAEFAGSRRISNANNNSNNVIDFSHYNNKETDDEQEVLAKKLEMEVDPSVSSSSSKNPVSVGKIKER